MTGFLQRLSSLLRHFKDEGVGDDNTEHLRSNSVKIVLSRLGSKIGDALANTKTVLPWVLAAAGAPTFFSALLAPVRESGALIPQIFIGNIIANFHIKKWFFVLGSLVQGLCIFAIALASLFIEGIVFGVWTIFFTSVFSLARAVCSLSSKDVLGKMIPKKRRGRLGGISASLAGAITIGVGIVITFDMFSDAGIIDESRALLGILTAAALFWFIAAAFFSAVKESKAEKEDMKVDDTFSLKILAAKVKELLGDRDYRLFLTVRSLMISSSLALPYFMIISQRDNNSSMSALGIFMVINGIADLCSGWVWGHFSDKSSRKVMLISALMTTLLLLTAAAFVFLSNDPSIAILVGLFFLLSVTHAGVRLGRKTYILDLATEANRIDYIAVGNTFIGIILLAVGLITALIASYSVALIFALFATTAALAALLALRLPEVE